MSKGRWSWDLDRIHAKRYRDNVVDLMVGRLNRLPLDTQKALQQLACLGNIAPVRMLSFDPREIGRGSPCGSLGGRSSGAGRAPGRLLPVRPRSRSGSRLFADPGGAARRSAPSNRETACGAHTSREAGGGDLRHRQSVQPRRGLDHLARRARAGGRAQSAGRQARQGLYCLRLGAEVSGRRCGAVAGRLLGAPARAVLRAGAAPRRMRIPDRRACGRPRSG